MATKLQVMVFALAFIGLIGSTLVVTRNEARAGSAHYQAQNMFVFGDPTDLVAGAATLTRTKKGIAYSVSTSELMPGANTIWIVIFNKPEHCAGGPGACVGSDLSTPTVLRERLAKTRWPDEVGNENWEYGTTLASLQELVTYWQTTYDWRQHERAMNAFQQYKVTIDGQPIHFIHEPGRSPRPMPLILTRGTNFKRPACSSNTCQTAGTGRRPCASFSRQV